MTVPVQLRALILDDEPKAVSALSGLLARHCPEVEIQLATTNASAAYEQLEVPTTNLLFLDIEMPEVNGFAFLENVQRNNLQVIFTTAYDKYALQAIRFSALDYLLKPIESSALIEAVKKAQQRAAMLVMWDSGIGNLLTNWRHQELRRLAIPDMKGTTYIEVADLCLLESDRGYTNLYLKDGTRIVSTRHLKEYELLLQDLNFFRVHYSSLVGLCHVKRYDKEEGGYLTLQNGKQVEISRRRKTELIERLNRL